MITSKTRNTSLLSLALIAVFFFAATVVSAQAATVKHYSMTGKISAIDRIHDTVVVQVPVAGNQLMTVGGPLVEKAVLKKDGRAALLDDFHVGDKVRVGWEKLKTGLDIEKLVAQK